MLHIRLKFQISVVLILAVQFLGFAANAQVQKTQKTRQDTEQQKSKQKSDGGLSLDIEFSFPRDGEDDGGARLLGEQLTAFNESPLGKDPVQRAKILYALSKMNVEVLAVNTTRQVPKQMTKNDFASFQAGKDGMTYLEVAPRGKTVLYQTANHESLNQGSFFSILPALSQVACRKWYAIKSKWSETHESRLERIFAYEVTPGKTPSGEQGRMLLGIVGPQDKQEDHPGGAVQVLMRRNPPDDNQSGDNKSKSRIEDYAATLNYKNELDETIIPQYRPGDDFWSDEFWRDRLEQGMTWWKIGKLMEELQADRERYVLSSDFAFSDGGFVKDTQRIRNEALELEPALRKTAGPDLFNTSPADDSTTSESESRLSRREEAVKIFEHSTTSEPLFGGIILGNRTRDNSAVPTRLKFDLKSTPPKIQITIKQNGVEKECVYPVGSADELWVAYHIARPPPEWKKSYGLRGTECNLVSCRADFGSDQCYFQMHPALASNELGKAAALADILSLSQAPELFDEYDPTNAAFQWFDATPQFKIVDNRLIVTAATGPPEFLLRPSFWAPSDPSQTKPTNLPPENLLGIFFQEVVEKRFLGSTPPKQLHRLTEQQLNESNQKTYVQAINKISRRWNQFDSLRLSRSPDRYPCLKTVNSLARTLAVLNWAADQPGLKMPKLPEGLRPRSVSTASQAKLSSLSDQANLAKPTKTSLETAWWQRPSKTNGGLPVKQTHFVVLQDGAVLGELTESTMRAIRFGEDCTLFEKRFVGRSDPDNSFSEVYQVAYRTRDRRPWCTSLVLSGKIKGKLQSQGLSMEPKGDGKWALTRTNNGQAVENREGIVLPENFKGFDELSFQLSKLDPPIKEGNGKYENIDLLYCPFDPSQFVHDQLIHAGKVKVGIGADQYDSHLFQLKRDWSGSESNLKCAPPMGRHWNAESIWIDSDGDIIMKEVKLKGIPQANSLKSQLQDSIEALGKHPHFKRMVSLGNYVPLETSLDKENAIVRWRLVRKDLYDDSMDPGLSRNNYLLSKSVLAVPADVLLDPNKVLTELRLRLRFRHPPKGKWIQESALQKVHQVNPTTFDLTLNSVDSVEMEKLEAPETEFEEGLCLRSTPSIEATHSRIHALIKNATTDTWNNKIDSLKSTLLENLRPTYRFVQQELPATLALEAGEGDCTEFATLFAAMARSLDLPCRIVNGFVFQEQSCSFVAHMWNEVLVEGRWRPVDATRFMPVDARYLKLEHLPDPLMPVDLNQTKRGRFYGAQIDSIEFIGKKSKPAIAANPVVTIHFQSSKSEKMVDSQVAFHTVTKLPVEFEKEFIRIFVKLRGRFLYAGKNSSSTKEIKSYPIGGSLGLELPAFATDLYKLDGYELATCVHYLNHVVTPAIENQLEDRYGKKITLAFRFALKSYLMCILMEKLNRDQEKRLSIEITNLAKQLGVESSGVRDFLQEIALLKRTTQSFESSKKSWQKLINSIWPDPAE